MKQRRSLRVGKKQQPGAGPGPAPQEIRLEELKAILERAKTTTLSAEDLGKLEAAVDTLAFLTGELEAKGTSIKRLRQLLFGARTEKTSKLFGADADEEPSSTGTGDATSSDVAHSSSPESAAGEDAAAGDEPREKRKGHGRNGAASYLGAEKVEVPHQDLKHGDSCPCCQKGKVYVQANPAMLLRITGMAPLSATRYEKEQLRCNLCGEMFTAQSPEGVGEEKYDESATSMIAVLKYGAGVPFTRLERLERSLGIPLPASTQWELVAGAADLVQPAHEELIRQAAQGELLHNDDTNAKILELLAQQQPETLPTGEPSAASAGGEAEQPDLAAELSEASAGEKTEEADHTGEPGEVSAGNKDKERTGVFTTAIVSMVGEHKAALFFTGPRHAGENLGDLLQQRAAELAPPIQMCDALSRNTAGEFETIVANCLVHGRRHFVDVVDSFPDEVRHVVVTLRKVYRHEDIAKKEAMTPEQRLRFHQEQSGPLMDELEQWMKEQLDERKVEPNSGLGEAIKYMQKHWKKLTLFLQVPGAPLDNNICERALKKAILHRRNSLFYKTMNGARVGDLFMSLLHTAELNEANPFDYLLQLQRHHEEVARGPGEWMPWNYKETLARPSPGPGPAP
jgi:hypothetical protein